MSCLLDLHAALEDIARAALAPPAAQQRLAVVRERHPQVRLTLLWDVEPYDGSIHYDVVARDASGLTTSMSVVAAGDALPWPLRGATRVGDRVLVEVDGSCLEIGDAVRLLDTLDARSGAGIAERIVQLCLVRSEVARRVAAATPDERAAAVPGFLAALGLTEPGDAERWCRVRGLGTDDLQVAATEHRVLVGLKRDGAEGLSYDAWLARRVEQADVRWFWPVGDGVPR
jgi:hypothetical protein